MTIFRYAARSAAVLATATMIATPVLAATRTVPITIPLSAQPATQPGWTSAADTWNEHRWRRYRHHRDGIDGGDVLAGILVIGGIAAIASAAEKSKQQRRDRREYPDDDRRYDYRDRDRNDDYGRTAPSDGRRAMDRAIDACAAEAARTGRVDEIFDVERIDGEWRVKGDYRNGGEFTCNVDSSGRATVRVGDRALNEVQEPGNSEDEVDDRYAAAQSPDFEDSRGR